VPLVAIEASAYMPDQQTFETLYKLTPGIALAKASCGVCSDGSG
jgi:hypothetical protein